MKLSFLLCRSLIVLALTCAAAAAQSAQSPLPAPSGYVNDFAGVIDSGNKNRLETTLTNLDRQEQIQFAVVTVDSTNGEDIYDYSLAVARGWGLGSKDTQKPSLLLLVAIKDRKYFTQVSRHLEGDLPDGLVGQIQREKLVPAFRAGDYGRGLNDTVNAYILTTAGKRGFSTDHVFAAGATPPPERPPNEGSSNWCPTIIFIIVIVLIVLAVGRRGGGRGFGGGGGWLGWLLLNSLLNSGRSSRGWGGGGFGGFSGGSGGGFGGGGFGGFGGGGDFGGGGSGGSW